MYNRVLCQSGLKKIQADCSSVPIQRHYGCMHWNATVVKREQLLKEGVTEDFLKRQVFGLTKWIENAKAGLVQQGWFAYVKPQRERTYIMIKPDGV